MEEEIDFKRFFSQFWEKKQLIAIIVVLFAIAGFAYTMFMVTPKYTASATMILAQTGKTDEQSSVTASDITLNDKLIATYKELAKSNTVVRSVINNLGLTEIKEDELKNKINVTAVTSTQMLKVSVTDLNPEQATNIANELTKVFSKKVSEIYKIDNISVIDNAETPQKPSNVNHKKDMAMFLLVGCVIAFAAVLVMNLLDNTIKDAKDVEELTNLIVLAELPECNFLQSRKGGRK